jgi:hypothetical protein
MNTDSSFELSCMELSTGSANGMGKIASGTTDGSLFLWDPATLSMLRYNVFAILSLGYFAISIAFIICRFIFFTYAILAVLSM